MASWRDSNPGDLIGKKRYLEILDMVIEKSKNPVRTPAWNPQSWSYPSPKDRQI